MQASKLKVGQSVRAFSASRDGSGHERVHAWDSERDKAVHQWTHRMVWENEHGPVPGGMVVAHLDHNAQNNEVSNLAAMTPYEHASYDYPLRKEAGFNGQCRNHKVTAIEEGGRADVYNGTVDDSHTYVILDPTPVAGHMSGIVSANCGEIPLTEWENCNLGHVNLSAFVTHAKDNQHNNGIIDWTGLINAHRLMTRFLIRATFGDVTSDRQADVLAKQRRIGVGHFGVQSFLCKQGIKYSEAGFFLPDDLCHMKRAVREEARKYAFELRIPEPVKVTTVAPTGTIAKLVGETEGIHPIYARYFIRRIRFSTLDPAQIRQVDEYRQKGFNVVDDVYADNTVVVEIPTKDKLLDDIESAGLLTDLVESVDQISLKDMLEFQKIYQTFYADNAVSFTVNFDPASLTHEDACDTIAEYLPFLKGTTLMPDGSRPLAPYERISQQQFDEWDKKLVQVEDGVDEECANGACPVR